MPLPSGTSISAADINSYLGRSSGTAVSFASTVKTLSNSESPNMNGARGQSAEFVSWTTGQSADIGARGTSNNLKGSAAFRLPNSQWRLAWGQYNSPSDAAQPNDPIFQIRTINTKMSTVNIYSAKGITVSTDYGTSFLNNTTMVGMLSDGTFLIVGICSAYSYNTVGNQGIAVFCITFNVTTGLVSSCKQYWYGLSYNNNMYMSGISSQTYNSRYLNCLGMKAAFCTELYTTGEYVIIIDATNNSASSQITFSYSLFTTGTYPYNDYASFYPVLLSSGSTALLYKNGNTRWWNVLNSAGTTITASGNTFAPSQGYVPVSPAGGVYAGSTYNNGFGTADRQGNYYNINGLYGFWNAYYIASGNYFTGSGSSVCIDKISASNNVWKWSLQLTGPGCYWATYYYYKGNIYYQDAFIIPTSANSVLCIETDSNDNTYILYATDVSGTGGSVTSTPLDKVNVSSPLTQQIIYHVCQVASNGYVQWTREIDLGQKITGLGNYSYVMNNADGSLSFRFSNWSMIVNDTIDVLEIYMDQGPRYAPNATYYDLIYNNMTSRSFMLRTSDGNYTAYSDATNISAVNTYYQSATVATTATPNGGSGAALITYRQATYYISNQTYNSNSNLFSNPTSSATYTLSNKNSTFPFNLRGSGGLFQTGTTYTTAANV